MVVGDKMVWKVAQEVLAERKMDGVGCKKKRKKMQWEIRKLLLSVTITLRGRR